MEHIMDSLDQQERDSGTQHNWSVRGKVRKLTGLICCRFHTHSDSTEGLFQLYVSLCSSPFWVCQPSLKHLQIWLNQCPWEHTRTATCAKQYLWWSVSLLSDYSSADYIMVLRKYHKSSSIPWHLASYYFCKLPCRAMHEITVSPLFY